MWEEASKAGLVLGLVSTAYLFATQLLGKADMSAILMMFINMLLWAVKFGLCIWMMMFFMKKFSKENQEADNSCIFRLGIMISVLSALVYAAASFANIAYISADTFTEQMDLLIGQMAPALDTNTTAQMDKMMENMPQITFFSNLIYCFIYGTVLSFILSRNIPSRNPFADHNSDEW